jgi:hypothetical protein
MMVIVANFVVVMMRQPRKSDFNLALVVLLALIAFYEKELLLVLKGNRKWIQYFAKRNVFVLMKRT